MGGLLGGSLEVRLQTSNGLEDLFGSGVFGFNGSSFFGEARGGSCWVVEEGGGVWLGAVLAKTERKTKLDFLSC